MSDWVGVWSLPKVNPPQLETESQANPELQEQKIKTIKKPRKWLWAVDQIVFFPLEIGYWVFVRFPT